MSNNIIWTAEKRTYIKREMNNGRALPDLAREFGVSSYHLRAIIRYYEKGRGSRTHKPLEV